MNVKLTAIILIIILTWVNGRGVKTGTGVSSAILLMVFMSLFLIIAFGLTSGHANIPGAFEMKTSDSSTVGFSGIFTAMLAAFWAYQGWASVGYVGGEIKNPNKNIPRGIAIGMAAIITLYLLANFTYLSLLPVQSLEQIHKSGNQIAAVEAVRVFWGNYGALFIALLICLTTLGCVSATILTSGRIYFAMAREGLFFPSVAKLNRARVPANSLLVQGIWACILVLSGTFDQLTDMIIFAVFIYYGATTLGVFILRKRMPDAPRPYKVWGYPVVPAIVILFSAALFINTIFVKPVEAAIGMGLMLTGVPMYFYFKRKQNQEITDLGNNQ
jgi:basic amino acid/polyamine antiporter, APA family